MFRSVTPKDILVQFKVRWKLYFVARGIHGQRQAQVCVVPLVWCVTDRK
jgi:hypothetical protein